MAKVANVLGVFKEATLKVSSSNSLISEVIPMAKMLKKAIQSSCEGDDQGIRGFKEKLLTAIDDRFEEHLENEKLLLATACDPR